MPALNLQEQVFRLPCVNATITRDSPQAGRMDGQIDRKQFETRLNAVEDGRVVCWGRNTGLLLTALHRTWGGCEFFRCVAPQKRKHADMFHHMGCRYVGRRPCWFVLQSNSPKVNPPLGRLHFVWIALHSRTRKTRRTTGFSCQTAEQIVVLAPNGSVSLSPSAAICHVFFLPFLPHSVTCM